MPKPRQKPKPKPIAKARMCVAQCVVISPVLPVFKAVVMPRINAVVAVATTQQSKPFNVVYNHYSVLEAINASPRIMK